MESSFFNATFALANADKIFNCGASGISSLDGRQLRFNQVMPTSGFLDVLLATAVLLLEQEGDVRLQNTLRTYFDKSTRTVVQNMPKWVLDISIRDLLLHNTGLEELKEVTQEQIMNVATLFTTPPRARRYIFSQRNNLLLLLLIEEVSGKTFNDFCFENIFRTLELENTNFVNGQELIKLIYSKARPGDYPIKYYVKDFHKRKASFIPVESSEVLVSNYQGFIASNVTDMINFYKGVAALKILNQQQYKKLIKPQFVIDAQKGVYKTYGAFAQVLGGRTQMIYNLRVAAGQTDFVGYIVDKSLYCSVVSNTSASEDEDMAMNFVQYITNSKI